jgi:hypothetical protein
MKQNVGIFDANLRIAFGVAIMVTLSLYGSGWALLGMVLTGTGFKHWCPLYSVFGINTLDNATACAAE